MLFSGIKNGAGGKLTCLSKSHKHGLDMSLAATATLRLRVTRILAQADSMSTHALVPFENPSEPRPWALTFVLLGWAFLLVACCTCAYQLLSRDARTRKAAKDEGACNHCHSRTSCRASKPEMTSESTHTGEDLVPPLSPLSTSREPSDEGRCSTPIKQGCVYSTHPSQIGSPGP